MELRIDSITKEFKDKTAVNNFTTTLENGIYGLLGPNGSGKTTLMRMLADVVKPTKGAIYVDGKDKDILDDDYRDLVGYLPQDIGFYKNFTAKKYLAYIAALKGIDKKIAKEKINDLLSFVNLESDKNRKVGGFSGGMLQRLGIAQALLNDPKILILDEPTAGLDPNERIRFKNLISNVSKDKIIILSTHIVSDIEFIANEIIIMRNGQLIDKEKPSDLLAKIKGKVWTAKINDETLYEINNKYKIASMIREGSDILVRIVGDDKPNLDCTYEDPNLEDVFLYYFKEGGSNYDRTN